MNKRKYLTETENKKIINEAYKGANPERDRCLIWMCFIHGCRVSEIRHCGYLTLTCITTQFTSTA
ncbi:integrase family protein [Klebsiella michiganensis]|nr:integrase family protein [Klebsiella michiganensis]